jgi:translation initiation factor 2B subunit (eIF-2B alpha/beta/delta family)
MSPSWDQRIRAIAEDHHAPSSTLAARSGELLVEVAEQDPELLGEVTRALVLSMPAMAAVTTVANVALRAVEQLGLQSVGKALDSLREAIEADRRAAATALCARVQEPVDLVTLSAHAAVAEAILHLQRRELLRGVICGESRPLLEGTALARWLVAQGCNTTLVPDAGLAEFLQPGALLVVGAEAITPTHVMHKRGIRMLATWARLAGVPRILLAMRDKICLRPLLGRFTIPLHPPEELLREPPHELHVDSRAYDLTPRDLWTDILVGAESIEIAESQGDHRLAQGLVPLATEATMT